jgi:hypothetical protein
MIPDDLTVLEARALLPGAERDAALADVAERRAMAAWREAREAAQRRILAEADPEIGVVRARLYRLLSGEGRALSVQLRRLQVEAAVRAGVAAPAAEWSHLWPTAFEADHESLLDTWGRIALAEGRLTDDR